MYSLVLKSTCTVTLVTLDKSLSTFFSKENIGKYDNLPNQYIKYLAEKNTSFKSLNTSKQ